MKETILNLYSSDLQTYLRSDYYKMPVYIYDTRDYFYFSYCGPEATDCYCIHSFKNNKTITWERKGDDADGMFMIGGADKDFFYGRGFDGDITPISDITDEIGDVVRKPISGSRKIATLCW